MSVKWKPDGYHTATPYLIVRQAAAAIEFYKHAFGAEELFRLPMGDLIGHAELRIGDSTMMLADEQPGALSVSPETLGGTTFGLMLYVPDVDARFATALAAGGTELRAVADQFYGDRSGSLRDPFGHVWTIATHMEDVAPEQLDERLRAMHAGAGS